MISLIIDADSGRMIATTTALPQAITATPTGLAFTGELSFEEWSDIGHRFGRGMESVAWCIGDWLLYGEAKFTGRVAGEAYDAAIAATGMDRSTLKSYASVCKSIPSNERIDSLSFYHHKSVAAMPSEKRSEWLKVVAQQPSRPSARRLRASIRAAATDKPHILTDEEILNRDTGTGHDNYGVHLTRLKTVLRKDFPNMDAQQKGVVKEEIAELLAIVGM
ncbi:hypothetical protein OKA05_02040 [Luteolibacter arcticus]|uniref:Uncharacterized protein n=1 Tax=Luteolibacter arcticus TaxID=1581411 RepID=A0ABT3GD21_9BACT|nr:hypothetical protein [Luteolibacter arcticus]MCW1921313.1 hypothetical protein [Luteolibacter arcticus]